MVVNHHNSFCIALNPQFPDIFLSRHLSKISQIPFVSHLSSNTHFLLTSVYWRWPSASSSFLFATLQFQFQCSQSILLVWTTNHIENSMYWRFYFIAFNSKFLTNLTLVFNIAMSEALREVHPLCKGKNGELDANMHFFTFFLYKSQFHLGAQGKKREEC